MNCLLAKVKTKTRTATFRKILSGAEIYTMPENLYNAIDYNPATLLGEDEWYKIENFLGTPYYLDLLTSEFSSVDYDKLGREEFFMIDYLCSFQDEIYYFQNISKSNLQPKKMIHFGDDYKYVKDGMIINVNGMADAIYVKNGDVLYFTSLSRISCIFKGIGKLYREATNEETEKFLNNEFIYCLDNFDASCVKTANRKRIAMAMDTLKKFSSSEKKKVFKYIGNYSQIYDSEQKRFNISSEEDLRLLLWGIEQRFYTTVVGNEKRAANSIISLG